MVVVVLDIHTDRQADGKTDELTDFDIIWVISL